MERFSYSFICLPLKTGLHAGALTWMAVNDQGATQRIEPFFHSHQAKMALLRPWHVFSVKTRTIVGDSDRNLLAINQSGDGQTVRAGVLERVGQSFLRK